MAKKQLDLSVIITYKDGKEEIYPSLEVASKESGLTVAAIKIRCNKSRQGSSSKKDKINCKWVNDTTFRSFQSLKSRFKGSHWEYELRDMFKKIGYEDCITSRGESRKMDNAKIDIVSETLPFYCQAKNLANTPSYFKISEECPYKDKPFVVCWKKSDEQGKSVAMIPMDFFLELLSEHFKNNKND